MPNRDGTGPRQRSRYPSRPMGGLRRGPCVDVEEVEKKEVTENMVEKILNKIIKKKENKWIL